jgi:hypothetical protein
MEPSQRDILTSILRSIHRQLVEKSLRFDTLASQNSKGSSWGPRDRGILRRSICTILHDLPCAFLVLDDLDQCGYQTAELLEEEFTHLRKHGLRIMTTSRVARFTRRNWLCNVPCREHYIPSDCDVWVCRKCYDEAEQADEQERGEMLDSIFVVCNSCKEAGETEMTCYR